MQTPKSRAVPKAVPETSAKGKESERRDAGKVDPNVRWQRLARGGLAAGAAGGVSGGALGDEGSERAVADAALARRGAGSPVDPGLRGKVEARLDVDLAHVRVHADANANAAAEHLGARAFTFGQDVFLGRGERAHDAALMAHELTHVAQQGAHGRGAPQRAGGEGESSKPAEQEADKVAKDVTTSAATAGLIVDGSPSDDAHMSRDDFLAKLRTSAIDAASQAIGPFWSSAQCAYIDRWFAAHASITSAALERLARQYSRIDAPARAADYLPAIDARLRAAITKFRAGEDIGGELSDAGISDLGTAAPPDGAAPAAGAPAASPPAAGPQMKRKDAAGPTLGEGARLDPAASARIGGAYGASFAHVRVHTGPRAARLAADEGAFAFTVGRDIVFGDGQYRPNTLEGDALLAHELAHVVQQKDAATDRSRGAPSGAHEADADRAAYHAMAHLHAGVTLPGERVPALRAGLGLQRCSKKHKLTDPFVLALDAKLRATPPDKVGVFNEIRKLAGAKAGDTTLRDGIDEWNDEGLFTGGDMFRAVALQELGEERTWSTIVKNFAEGADKGTFTVDSLPPAGADGLREYCVQAAEKQADQTGKEIGAYRARFNAKWDSPAYKGLSVDFDKTLDSKGPRTPRARKIFEDLYAEADIKKAYDGDSPSGFRNVCDTLVLPEGINLIASPRLQELRALFTGSTKKFSGTADPDYVTFKATVVPKAQALDGPDRTEINRSHAWRLAIDAKVEGNSPAVTQALRDDLWYVVTSSFAAPAAVAPPPTSTGSSATPPPEPAPTLNAAQSAFLSSITLTAPPPQNATTDKHPIKFDIKSGNPNPALVVRRKVVIEPSSQVVEGQEDETAWPNASSDMSHSAKVNPETSGPAVTFTAKLTMPPVPVATFPEKSASVVVTDKRLDWFKANVAAGVEVMKENQRTGVASGGSAPYFGGQLPLRIEPALSGGSNPGLRIGMEGDLTKDGAAFKTLPRVEFPAGVTSAPLFKTVLEEPSPAPAVAEKMVLTIRFFSGTPGVLVHTLTFPFDITPALAVVPGADAALLAADDLELNRPITTAGTFLQTMLSAAAPGSPQALVAQAAASGGLKAKPCIVRSDSAAWVKAHAGKPAEQVAYALGQVDDAHTMAERPGAIGWSVPSFPGVVFLNLTPDTHNAANKRGYAQMAGLLTHEGIHAMDRAPGGDWGQYVKEFRAYWTMGTGSGLSTAPDASMSNFGPKSPRANNIFKFLYLSPTYPFVKPAYDGNIDHFREKVDSYFYPDGINLPLSTPLAELRKEIESYSGTKFAAKKTAISAKFTALGPAEQDEVKRNREWRDLVEDKFKSVLWTKEVKEIKTILGITQ